MARNGRVILNRAKLDQVEVAVADGFLEVGRTVLDVAVVPDAPPYNEGLVNNGGVVVHVRGKKVGGFGLDGREPRPPRSVRPIREGVTATIGYGFPARFVHDGTSDTKAQPWLARAMPGVVEQTPEIAGPIIRERLARLK